MIFSFSRNEKQQAKRKAIAQTGSLHNFNFADCVLMKRPSFSKTENAW
jgi:hypothetical protein